MTASLFEQRASFSYRTTRGHFKCDHCDRHFSTRGGRADHARVHGEEAYARARSALHSEEVADEKRKKLDKENERRRLQARAARQVVLSTDEIDEIICEMENLISMMEPYWSQGDSAKNAEALIKKLNDKADGRTEQH